MADTLSILIEVENRDAVAKLTQTDRAVAGIQATAHRSGGALSAYDNEVRRIVDSKRAATSAIDIFGKKLGETGASLTVTNHAALSLAGTFASDMVQGSRESISAFAVLREHLGAAVTWLSNVGRALLSLRWSDVVAGASALRGGLNGVAESAGFTIANLGLMNAALAAVASAYAGWHIGTMINDFFKLSETIGTSTLHMGGFALAVQTAAAKGDSIELAIKRGAAAHLTYGEAVRFNEQFVKNYIAAFKDLDDVLARTNAPAEFAKQVAVWHSEIRKISDAGSLETLKAGLKSGAISVNELSASYRISVGAINLFKKELADEADALRKTTAATTAATAATKKAADELDKNTEAAHKAEFGWSGLIGPIEGVRNAELEFIGTSVAMRKAMDDVERTVHAAHFGLKGLADGIENVGTKAEFLADGLRAVEGPELPTAAEQAKQAVDEWADSLDKLNQAFVQLAHVSDGAMGKFARMGAQVTAGLQLAKTSSAGFVKGMDSWKAGEKTQGLAQMSAGIMGMVGAMDQATSHASKLGNTLHGALTGAQIGAQFGLWGAAIGAIGGGLIGLFRHVDHTKKALNEFISGAGGLDTLKLKADAAGLSLSALFAAKDQKGLQSAIDTLNKGLAEHQQRIADANTELGGLLKTGLDLGVTLPASLQLAIEKLIAVGTITKDNAGLFASLTGSTEVDFKKMQGVAEKYGIDLKALGPAFQSAKLSEAAKIIINDFDLLQRGGADVDAVLAGMKKPINDLVNESLAAGLAIPENFRPWVEQLFKTGQLVDENGNKIEDLSGLKFAPPIVTEFQKIVDKLQELIDKIGTGLIGTINSIPTQKTIHVGYEYEPYTPPDYSGASYHGGGVILPFVARAHRGLAVDEVPLIGLRGEGILNRQAMRRIGGPSGLQGLNAGSGGGQSIAVSLEPGSIVIEKDLTEREAEEVIGKTMVRTMRRKGVRFG